MGTLSTIFPQWRITLGGVLACVSIASQTLASPLLSPFHGCTFYKARLALPSYAGGQPFLGCANFSAVNGRNGCTKTKGVCPFCVVYSGDDVQMWVPDYFIEVTKHVGRSVFAESVDAPSLKFHLQLASKWWEASTLAPATGIFSNGSTSPSGRESFWHARILTIPYGSWVNNFPPLASSKGVGLPSCFSGLSEFLPAQWNFNLADAPYAAAWAPAGIPLCLSPVGASAMGALQEARARVSQIASSTPRLPDLPVDPTCANPVGASEAFYKNALPTSDALAPLKGEVANKLCMGSWGNLLPRTGWVLSEDPHMSAMIAAYKFMSAAGDFHLSEHLKLRTDDKWQIVYPPQLGSGCFTPGSPLKDLPPAAEDPVSRGRDEVTPFGALKNNTYVIAVWRRRSSCEEPLQWIGGWDADFKANYLKNQAICQAAGAL